MYVYVFFDQQVHHIRNGKDIKKYVKIVAGIEHAIHVKKSLAYGFPTGHYAHTENPGCFVIAFNEILDISYQRYLAKRLPFHYWSNHYNAFEAIRFENDLLSKTDFSNLTPYEKGNYVFLRRKVFTTEIGLLESSIKGRILSNFWKYFELDLMDVESVSMSIPKQQNVSIIEE